MSTPQQTFLPASSTVFSSSISSTIAVNSFTFKYRSYLQLHGLSSCCWVEAVLSLYFITHFPAANKNNLLTTKNTSSLHVTVMITKNHSRPYLTNGHFYYFFKWEIKLYLKIPIGWMTYAVNLSVENIHQNKYNSWRKTWQYSTDI